MSNGSNTFIAFLSGVVAGTLVGILYAPDKGINTRDKLSYQLEKYQESLQKLIDQLLEGDKQHASEAKTEGQKVISEAIKHAEKLMNEVDALKKQISSQE